MFFMFFIVAYFTAPLISFAFNFYLLDKENISEKFSLFLLFFVLDNVLVCLIITLLKGRINILEYMNASSKFMAVFLIISSFVGISVPVILKFIKENKFPLQINTVPAYFNERIASNIQKTK